MAYDEELAHRIRAALSDVPDLTERSMFGGLGFMVAGNMAVAAASKGSLMVRIDPADAEQLTQADGVDRMEMRGRRMDGWLLVEQSALQDDAALQTWIGRGLDYARALPPK